MNSHEGLKSQIREGLQETFDKLIEELVDEIGETLGQTASLVDALKKLCAVAPVSDEREVALILLRKFR